MKKVTWGVCLLVFVTVIAGCRNKENVQEEAYMNITQEEAKKIMDTQEGIIILDVRTP